MRPWPILLLLLLPMPAFAQETVWEDAAADADGPVPDGAMDLRRLTIEEAADGFEIVLTVGALDATAGWRADAGRWIVHLDHGIERRVHMGRSLDGNWWSMLEQSNPAEADGFSWVANLAFAYDESAGTVATSVPRGLLADANGAPPVAGRTLDGIYAWSLSHVGGIADRLPDSGVLSLPVRLGPAQTGAITLSSADPWRASNGAASTYVFEVRLDNAGAATRVDLAPSGVPQGWSVLLPEPVVDVEAGQTATVPVVLQTPFAHQHGARQSFVLEARAAEAAAGDAGRVELGLEFLAVPQPSGHHSKLWFHSRSQGNPLQPANEVIAPGGYNSYLVMNAVEDEEADTREPKEARPTNGPLNDRAYWFVPLSPELRMGLDFDVGRNGRIEVPVLAPATVSDAVLMGWMYRCVPTGDTWDCDTLASWTSEPTALQGSATLVADVVPEKEADRVEYAPRSYLSLALVVVSQRPQSGTGLDQLELAPGGWIDLPLEEYADPVDELFASDALAIQARAAELGASPGAPSVFELVLDNRLSEGIEVELHVSGTHAEWARLEGASQRRLGALDREVVRVVVQPPADAAMGERADLIVAARSPAGSSLARLVATVTEPSAEVALDEAKESPGAPLLAALAVALLARRGGRRQR